MRRVFKISVDIILITAIVTLCICIILRLFGVIEIYKVKTGSMEDGIHTGDYILICRKSDYDIGDVVTYKKNGYHVTHRIIKKNGNKITTKGDANNTPDEEITINDVVGRVIYNGGILNFIINFKYAIASLFLGLYLLSYYLDTRKKEAEEKK